MLHGHIPCRNTKAVFMGITGTGKTCVIAITLDEEPSQEHDCTPMMQRPVQAVVVHVDRMKWIKKDPQEMRKVFAAVVTAHRLHRSIVFVMHTPQLVTSQENGHLSSNFSSCSGESYQPAQPKDIPQMPGSTSQTTMQSIIPRGIRIHI